jgi:hypothetical protein
MNKPIYRKATIRNESIAKKFKLFTPQKIISEYIWNGIDAKATIIDVKLHFVNEEFKATSAIEILDNGVGINFQDADNNFDRWDSSEKNSIHERGSEGRGRFSFSKLSNKVTWSTRHNNENALLTAYSTEVPDYTILPITEAEQVPSVRKNQQGTCVYLSELDTNESGKIPTLESLLELLSYEFGWKLIVDDNLKIRVNGIEVKSPEHELFINEYKIDNEIFSTQSICWKTKPLKEKSFNYFYDSSFKKRHRELTGLNNKDDFYLSCYIDSNWFNEFSVGKGSNSDLFQNNNVTSESKTFNKLLSILSIEHHKLYNDFIASQADNLVEQFEKDGYFPVYSYETIEETKTRISHTKQLVKNIHIASPSTFNGLNKKKKHQKILIALLDKITVSSENDSLFEVLEGVLDLDPDKLDTLASQIKRTKLDHIISTIGLLQKRSDVIQQLEYLFENFSSKTKETPDLQKIIENHIWLFGAQYEIIGAEEDDFQKTCGKLLRTITDKDEIEIEDLLDKNQDLADVRGQVDLFLARRMITFTDGVGQHFKCTVIEIKRPGQALNAKHFHQIQRYAQVLANHSGFNDHDMTFDIILVGRRLAQNDYIISQALKDFRGKGNKGLVFGTDDRIKGYVRTWAEIFSEYKISNTHLLTALKSNRLNLESETKETLVNDLQAE